MWLFPSYFEILHRYRRVIKNVNNNSEPFCKLHCVLLSPTPFSFTSQRFSCQSHFIELLLVFNLVPCLEMMFNMTRWILTIHLHSVKQTSICWPWLKWENVTDLSDSPKSLNGKCRLNL